MAKKLLISYLLAAVPASAVPLYAQSPAPTDQWDEVELSVVMKGIDLEKREVTVETPLGEQATLEVDKRLQGLNEVTVGDKVSGEYYRYGAAEFRAPTPEERQQPIQYGDVGEKRPPGISPGARDFRLIRAAVTIEALNHITETATVKGPMGRHLTVGVADPRKLEQVHIGDTVVLSYADALIVTLNPAE